MKKIGLSLRKPEMAKLYRGGFALSEIARQFSCNPENIRYHLKRMGIPRRRRGEPPVSQKRLKNIAELYQKGFSLDEVGKRVGRRGNTILYHLQRLGIPRRKKGFRFLNKAGLIPEKGYILGIVGPGDGSIVKGKMISLGVTDKDFTIEFANSLKRCYGVRPKIMLDSFPRKKQIYKVNTKHQQIVSDILSYHDGDLKKFREGYERIPPAIFSASSDVKAAYLRGFFDSQGCVKPPWVIEGSKANITVLKEIQILLSNLAIQSRIWKKGKGSWPGSKRESYAVAISRKEARKHFYDKIGFSIGRKQQKLEQIIRGSEYD